MKENTSLNTTKTPHANKEQVVSDFSSFKHAVSLLLPEQQIISRYLQRFAYGTDASFYRLIPKLVLLADTTKQVTDILKKANEFNVAVTFRAAGTSLSGQAITDSVLIMLSSQWQNIQILENGDKVHLQPGVIGAQANKALSSYSRKIGPDPASINSCKIGGIAANNSSGMCCGVKDNSYHTLADISLIFADGTLLDTSSEQSKASFLSQRKPFIAQLMQLVDQIKANSNLVDKIRHKYRLKNTTGYGINALIDYSDPIDIISHLLIGSEGTLAFISDITYHTVPVLPNKATGLYIFDSMDVACQLVEKMAVESVDAIEIMDSRALKSVQAQLISLLSDKQELGDHSTGLLIEFSAQSNSHLQAKQQQLEQIIAGVDNKIVGKKQFTTQADEIELLWKIRKGMFPAVGAVRKLGTTVVIEDVAFPLENLAAGIEALQQLFTQHHYDEAIIFGHALDGNLHFVFTQTFETELEIKRYQDFMQEVTQLVAITYQGSLKAEHGTGRNMAPFVEMEWGETLYKVMTDLKTLFDPKNILNPGVIINDDAQAHLKHLKTMTAADDIIDTCIECGFCESVCPSKDFTITPRQRIALWRHKAWLTNEIKSASAKVKNELGKQLAELKQDYQFYGIDSCAATGLCGQQCPVGIDTGMFIKSLREKQNDKTKARFKQLIAKFSANHFSSVSQTYKLGLNAVAAFQGAFGAKATKANFKCFNKLSNNTVPLWFETWPKAGRFSTSNACSNLNNTSQSQSNLDKVVYLTACANRVFAADNKASDQRTLPDVVHSLCKKANIEVIVPKNINNLCCGMPWQSKGFTEQSQQKQQEFIQAITEASEGGIWPVMIDASPCAMTTKLNESLDNNIRKNRDSDKREQLAVLEATEFFAKYVLDKLQITPTDEIYMLHNTCSSIKMDQGKYLQKIAKVCSSNVIEPDNIHCCGFAGDKGFYLPELNKSALAPLKSQIPQGCSKGVSNSRTCEIGLSQHSGVSYQSILYLLDQCSVAK